MSDLVQERRRWVRITVGDGCELTLGLAHRVRLLEISMTGALVRVSEGSPIGKRAELRTTLDDTPFVVPVEIRRVAVESPDGKWAGDRKVGAVFISLDFHNRRCLERFLRQPASS